MIRRGVSIFVAFVAGWIVYMIAAAKTVKGGVPEATLQPFMAAICTGITVLAVLALGLVFRIPPIGRWWRKSKLWAVALIALSLFLMCFGSRIGLSEDFKFPQSEHVYVILRPDVALPSYFTMIFALANWPGKPSRQKPETP